MTNPARWAEMVADLRIVAAFQTLLRAAGATHVAVQYDAQLGACIVTCELEGKSVRVPCADIGRLVRASVFSLR